VVIALVPQQAQAAGPPRTLAVPFELGRPLGVPNDPAFQHRVLDAALALLERNDGPVFETYAEEAPLTTQADNAWSCPVTFPTAPNNASLAQRVTEEIALLQPWYDKGRAERGFTSVGIGNLSLADSVALLAAFVEDHSPDAPARADMPRGGHNLGDATKYAAEDLKAFYNEAATSQPGAASAKDLENWYWGETNAGKLVREVKKATVDEADPAVKVTGQFLLVPGAQAFRDP
jgi:hypothetical protein